MSPAGSAAARAPEFNDVKVQEPWRAASLWPRASLLDYQSTSEATVPDLAGLRDRFWATTSSRDVQRIT